MGGKKATCLDIFQRKDLGNSMLESLSRVGSFLSVNILGWWFVIGAIEVAKQ